MSCENFDLVRLSFRFEHVLRGYFVAREVFPKFGGLCDDIYAPFWWGEEMIKILNNTVLEWHVVASTFLCTFKFMVR